VGLTTWQIKGIYKVGVLVGGIKAVLVYAAGEAPGRCLCEHF